MSKLGVCSQVLVLGKRRSPMSIASVVECCTSDFVPDAEVSPNDEVLTQPAVSSQDVREREDACRQACASIYARLQPLDRGLDPIELRKASSMTAGRSDDDPVVDHSFRRLYRTAPALYCMLSKRHFSVEKYDSDHATLLDLSRNGTFVNQKLVGCGKHYALEHGDVISLGHPDFFAYMYDEEGKEMEFPEVLNAKYLITSHILGTGGYGKVVLGKRRSNAAHCVAIKMLAKRALSHRFSRTLANNKEIENEVQCMLAIDHPNCVHFEEWIETESEAFIVLEYVGGGELFDRIIDERRNGHGLGEALTKFYALQLFSAIEYLHARGITHRDIKPENILMFDREEYTVAKLTDFGLSKRPDTGSTMRTFCGTPTYIAPEMLQSENEKYSPAVDIWSLGVVLFTAIVGYPPFSEGYEDGLVLNDQIKTGRLIFTRLWKEISLEAQTVIRRMLRVDPEQRITASEALKRGWFDEKTRGQVEERIRVYMKGRKSES